MSGEEILGGMLRGLHLAALVSAFGILMFGVIVLRGSPEPEPVQTRLALLARLSTAVALVSGIAWFAERAAAMAGAGNVAEALAALPAVALDTRFGHLLMLRGTLLLALSALLAHRRAWPAAILLAGTALGVQAATSHAGAMAGDVGPLVLGAAVLHVLAAGAWLGALVPLLIVLAGCPADAVALVLRRFFPFGLVAVSVVGITASVQATYMVGSVAALVGTAYGRLVLVKLLLFLALLGFAAANRFVFGAAQGVRLRRSVMAETACAAVLVLVLAAGSLAQLTPGSHQSPVWPFAWRINPAIGGALLIPANPASYFVSPTGFSAAAIVRGEAIFQSACAGCHGSSGRGDGRLARTLPTMPADLTAPQLLELADGDLFWRAGHAIGLSDDARWDLVDYLRARNRGEFVRSAGRGVHMLRIPRFRAICADGTALAADDLAGKVLRVTVPRSGSPGAPGLGAPVTTIALAAEPGAPCVAQPEALAAFAILLGSTPAAMAGSQFLIDANGWLRGRWRQGEAGGWGTPDLLLARAQALADHPLPPDQAYRPHRH